MTKSPEEIDSEKSPALTALQAMKYEEDDPIGQFVYSACAVWWVNCQFG